MAEKRSANVNDYGFIHHLSPVKKSKNKHEWFDFHLQTSPTKTNRVVGFNMASHGNLKHFQDSKTPVILRNMKLNANEEYIFNQQSYVSKAANSDIAFEYADLSKPDEKHADMPSSMDVKISEIRSLKTNQKVNVSGTLSIGEQPPKQVQLKVSKKLTYVKEDCVIEDSSGAIVAHIWEPLINELENGESYHFKHLTVRSYLGSTFLSSSYHTSVTPSTLTLQSLTGPQMLSNPDRELSCANFKLVKGLVIFSSCQLCKKRLNDISSSTTLKCPNPNCGTRQRRADVALEASVKVCVENEGADLWLNVFTDHVNKLLQACKMTLKENSSDDIEECLMNIEQIELKYNVQTKNVTDILSFKSVSEN